MIAALYAAATSLAAPALRLHLRRRARRGKEIAARLGEREGVDATPRPPGKLLWLHAASVGESVSVLPVLAALPAEISVVMTTGTVTSAALLARRLPEMGLADRVIHRFAPLDVPAWADRFVDHWRPDAAVFVESEVWPNLLRACDRRNIPRMLTNARLSARSFRSWRRVSGFATTLFAGFASVHPQSQVVAHRLRALGAIRQLAPGNLKFAAAPLPVDAAALEMLDDVLADRPVWLAASTHPGEEALIRGVHARLAVTRPRLLTIIVPRHPERGAALALELSAPRRALGASPPDAAGIWLADTLGELGLFYRRCPIVFVGRSLLAPGGGQNPLEPARLGCAVAVGPYTGNFDEIVAGLNEVGALAVVPDVDALAAWVADMLDHPARRAAMGEAGVAAAAGAAELPAQLAAALVALMRP